MSESGHIPGNFCTDVYNEIFMIMHHLHIHRKKEPSVLRGICTVKQSPFCYVHFIIFWKRRGWSGSFHIMNIFVLAGAWGAGHPLNQYIAEGAAGILVSFMRHFHSSLMNGQSKGHHKVPWTALGVSGDDGHTSVRWSL